MTTPSDPFTPEGEMLELFRTETSNSLQSIRDDISLYLAEALPLETFQQRTINAIHKMGSTARMLQFTRMDALLQAAESYLTDSLKNKEGLSNSILSTIIQTLDWMSDCIALDNAQFLPIAVGGDLLLETLVNKFTGNTGDAQKPPTLAGKKIKVAFRQETRNEGSSDPLMMDLFKVELENQLKLLSDGLLELEKTKAAPQVITSLMRAAHSLKGASRVVSLSLLSDLAHSMEDYFVAIQDKKLAVTSEHVDQLLTVLDFLAELNALPSDQMSSWVDDKEGKFLESIAYVQRIVTPGRAPPQRRIPIVKPISKSGAEEAQKKLMTVSAQSLNRMRGGNGESLEVPRERVLRVTAQSLNRLMGLAGESRVESRWLSPFSDSLLPVKKSFNEISHIVDVLSIESLEGRSVLSNSQNVQMLKERCIECRTDINDRLAELDTFINRNSSISDRLYREVIQSRMRAFADCLEPFPRMVRDIARQLHKKVRLEIRGKDTPLDRDILEKLVAPLGHLLRNAVDHGIETPEHRLGLGKQEEGVISLEAEHKGGMLSITLSDDGAGINVKKIREEVLRRGIATPDMVLKLSQNELVEFIFQPGFSTCDSITDISGRGIGLNVVQDMVNEVGGQLTVSFIEGEGTTFTLRLPLTLSVIRSLIVEISGEPYAFPLGRIERALMICSDEIITEADKNYISSDGKRICLVDARQILDYEQIQYANQNTSVVIVNDGVISYGLIVDAIKGEKELVVQELDRRLGKVPNISAGAFFEDGSPLLIFDIDDLIASINQILEGKTFGKARLSEGKYSKIPQMKILVAEDSATVRELECRILDEAGYSVTGVKNGREAWNALRIESYDLLITDIDMPRMNGIELTNLIRADRNLAQLPIIIISYRDKHEDRKLGNIKGANSFLTKGSYSKEDLVNAATQLIGPPNQLKTKDEKS